MTTLDGIDRGLIHALQVDGRVAFSRVAAVLGTSTQTVVRRYRRLWAEGGLRVVGLPDPDRGGGQRWIVRLTAATGAASNLARALARRTDTSWVKITSGGTQIVVVVHGPPGSGDPPALLLRDLPRTAGITAVSAHYLLHHYRGGPTTWPGVTAALTAGQRAALAPPETAPDRSAPPLGASDESLLAALRADGRTSYTDLAAATGWSAGTVTRRVAELRAAGTLFFDVEFDDRLFGVTTQALLWMSVRPAHLDRVAAELAGHDELAFVIATTGPTNLLAQALCPGPAALHHYLTHRLALDPIAALETAPVLRTLKAVGPVRPV